MKKLFVLAALIAVTPVGADMSINDLASIHVTLTNIKTERGGQLVVFVFTENGFPKEHDKALLHFIAPVTQETTTIKIDVPKRGHFAIKALHDENMDMTVTKNWTGIIPRDGMGFSNGARIRLAPPSFSDARVEYHETYAPHIELHYF